MERYIHNANIAHYRYLIAESERNPKRRDENRHKMLLTKCLTKTNAQWCEKRRVA